MIIPDQRNIKVHFAGAETLMFSNVIHDVGGANYSLYTIFPFLAQKLGIPGGFKINDSYKDVAFNNMNKSRHTIQDSGLFTLMFGSHSGEKSPRFIENWYHGLVELTRENGFTGSVVEVDCQKVLGIKKAWELRERMKIDLPDNRQINVFHLEDGHKGLDRMIEFSDYIAISVPELRANGKKNYTQRLANYIKNKKPSIDIHLLGCTENKLLKELSFCSSADSTSWVALNRFGWFSFHDGEKSFKGAKSSINREYLLETYGDRIREAMRTANVKEKESLVYYHSCGALQVEYFLKQYEIYGGPQN